MEEMGSVARDFCIKGTENKIDVHTQSDALATFPSLVPPKSTDTTNDKEVEQEEG